LAGDEVTLRGALLLVPVLLTFFALVAGVDAAAHIPINVSAKSVTPKIHFEKFAFLVMSSYSLSVEAFVEPFLIEARVGELAGKPRWL
jgi:hypothetical protein